MTRESSINLEMTIILPLGVVANQLMKIEARLENIHEALDSIRALVSDIEADIHPWSEEVTRTAAKEYTSSVGTHLAVEDDSPSSSDLILSKYSGRKSRSDQDD